jgi:hypothetical protein
MSRAGTFLRDLIEQNASVPDAVAVTSTVEFASFMDRASVWQADMKVTGDEAVRACVLMLEAMRGGALVDWHMEALGFLNQARAELGTKAPPVQAASPTMDGGVSVLEEPDAEAGPLVSELEQPEPELVPGSEDAPPTFKHTDPGIPGLSEMVDEARRVARDLEGQGVKEDTFAKELLKLAEENAGRIVSLGLLVGAYALGAKYIGGRLVIAWGWNAAGAEFERRLARSLQVTEQLEEGVRRIDQVLQTIRELDGSGAGINWKTAGEHFSPRAVAQLDSLSCGPTCVKMIMEDHGLPEVAQQAIIEAIRGGGDILTTSVEQLADFLNTVDPAGKWAGGSHPATWPDKGDNMLNMARRLSAGGSWIADARVPGAARVGHFVLVEAVAEDGTLSIRDPWAWLAGEKLATAENRQASGTVYQIAWKEFHRHWTGGAVWTRAKGP